MPEVEERIFNEVTPDVPEVTQHIELSDYLFTGLCRLSVQLLYEYPLKDVRVDLSKDYPPVDYLLSRNGVGCVPRGDIQGLGGKMKNGKTTAGICMVVALLKGEFMGFKATKGNYKCLIVDTEQSISNVVGKAKIIHRLVGWSENANNERLIPISLRHVSRKGRAAYLTKAIEIERPDFVLLDGAVDICEDFMDSSKSRETVDSLMKLSKACAIMCVLHTNKSGEDLRGHLGTELMNKCSEAYMVSKTNNIATVKQTVCRNQQISDWAFSIGEGGVPEVETVISKADEKKEDLHRVFLEAFRQKSECTTSELRDFCFAKLGILADMANKKINEAVTSGIISRVKKGVYQLGDIPQIIPTNDVQQEDESDNIFG